MNGLVEFCGSFDYFSIYRLGTTYLLFRHGLFFSLHYSYDSALSEAVDWCADDYYSSLIYRP